MDHSVNAEFNMQAPVTLKGVVSKLEWMNPHSWIYVDAKDDSGNITDSLKEGQEVTITGSKDGTNTCTVRGQAVTQNGCAGAGKQ
jgi:DNA/RNA endonuclease YhcR with UshA esterase domain